MASGLADNLRRTAHRYGAYVALKDGARFLRYEDLWLGAQCVAAALGARGVAPGERVAIVLPNTIEYVLSFYGVLLAGGIAVPLNPTAKSRDLVAWLASCEPAAVFGRRDDAELAAAVRQLELSPRLIHAAEADFAELLKNPGGRSLAVEPHRDQPAMIAYTSGTTRQPKGVTLSHGNLASNTDSVVASLGLRHDDSIVTVLPFCHSYGSSVLHTHISVGGRLVLERNFVYPHQIVQTMQQERVTGFAGVPSTYALLLARVKLAEYDLSSLRYLTQAGGHMSVALIQRVRAALPHAALYAMYGQTEATARISCLAAEEIGKRAPSVGKPLAGVAVEIRDERGHVLENGGVGDVWIAGPNVMLGYWRDEAATAAVLRGGWLRTGDVGYLDSDGYLYLHGRRSDIIKVGAYRVHPEDIEDVIAELPAVREAAVTAVDDELLGQAIKAFVVIDDRADISASAIQAHCRARLAPYKIPKNVSIVASLPKTHSGKVKRIELASRATV